MQIHSLNVKVAEVVGVNKALLLQYIEFWVEKNRANDVGIYEGKAWVYHTANGFAQIFPYMKPNTICKYLIELENDGYIVSMKNPDKSKNRNNQTKFYTLTQKYFEIMASKNQNEFAKNQNEFAKNQNEFAKNQNEFAKNQNLYNDFSELENNIFSSFKLEKNLEKELEKNPSCAQADARSLFAQDLTDVANLPQDKPSEQDFEAVWRYYPRKVGKKKARETFKRVIKSQEILNKLHASLKDHRLNVWRDTIAKGKLEYIPHLSTFLHQERWEDEITPSDSTIGGSSTQAIFDKALGEHSALPDKSGDLVVGDDHYPQCECGCIIF